MAKMSKASKTVAVGYTSQYPVIPDQHIIYVTVGLDLFELYRMNGYFEHIVQETL
jgi:hypothetical protein